ncbi:nucleolar protein of 40 kDa isoform X2 [Ornithorhynchus anatinus]|uniref:nucleolar protein of 40 kDa isoform X2 n=1 Tax=Ornithorhynchus anatinus TaxID=9258 RepID=UPI0019D43C7E|nr:nucleolar protein of 40 kDa isoform X2 [Ornithorhynchus anatinus]
MISGREDGEGSIPDLYSIFRGEVASVKDYGAFVRIPGCRKQGLVHRTHMSSCRVDKPSEMVDVGDTVWVKLIGREVKDDKVKLSLSMKVVHQGTGQDLDPNNVVLDQEERRKRSFKDFTGQKITLEAVLNTVCKKCGCKGEEEEEEKEDPQASEVLRLRERRQPRREQTAQEEEEETPSQGVRPEAVGGDGRRWAGLHTHLTQPAPAA